MTSKISDKLIRDGLFNLAGEQRDRHVPGRRLDLITIQDVLSVARKDEEGITGRSPDILHGKLAAVSAADSDRRFAQLVKDHPTEHDPGC